MKALIVTGGECPPSNFIRKLAAQANIVIAADSGFDSARKAGIEPDFVVGDFDSIEDKARLTAFSEGKIAEYPEDKDDTDTEIALATAFAKGASHIMIAGGGGGRLDHLLAIACLFNRGAKTPREWHTNTESVYYIRHGEAVSFELEPGALVSVFPAGAAQSRGMNSSGLKWPLEGLEWDTGYFGISNRSLGKHVEISAGSCALLIVVPIGSECFFKDSKAF